MTSSSQRYWPRPQWSTAGCHVAGCWRKSGDRGTTPDDDLNAAHKPGSDEADLASFAHHVAVSEGPASLPCQSGARGFPDQSVTGSLEFGTQTTG